VINQSAATAVKEMGLEGRFAELERVRLAKLANEWLDIERARAPFEVAAIEQQRDLKVAGLEMQSRIDRMDRIAGGGHALIDYKTGMVNIRYWDGPRPDDPQLPLYAVVAPEQLTAVVFAKLKAGEMRFLGHSAAPHVMPKVEMHADWPQLVAQWKQTVEALGESVMRGGANVDPKEDLKTCRRCDLQTLCRVYEKL
jgi:ATP-dependent helicase/nuclease subunit B